MFLINNYTIMDTIQFTCKIATSILKNSLYIPFMSYTNEF